MVKMYAYSVCKGTENKVFCITFAWLNVMRLNNADY